MSGLELKSCPFCGAELIIGKQRIASCKTEGCAVQHRGVDLDYPKHIAAWNRRTPDTAQIRADALREALGNAATTIKNLVEVMATPDQQQCCDGRMCGCRGSTVYQEAEYCALQDVAAIAALLDATLSPTVVDGSIAPDAGGKGEAK